VLVGRERELGVLRQHLDAAISGHGSLVLIGGEAGIGKTALAEALCREAAEQGALILVGRCYDLTETPPYGPWIELFASYPQDAAMPPLPAAFATRGTVSEVPSQAAFFHDLRDFLVALTTHRPLVLLFDDLHWADTATLDLLRFLGRAGAELALLTIVTYRSDELTRRHPLYQLLPLLEREAHATRLDLRPLSPEAVRLLVTSRYPLTEREADRVAAWLVARAAGNTFFTLQLLRALEDEAALTRTQGRWSVGDLDALRLPLAVRQVIDGRLIRLDDDAQRLLAVAAVIGHEVALDVWMAVAETDEETLARVIEQAVMARLIDETTAGVRFVHALIREALYAGLPGVRRRGLHRRIAELLAGQRAPDPDAVGYHFQQASDARAVAWLIQAGDRALLRDFVYPIAIARYDTALALMDLAHEGDTAQRAWLLVHLAVALVRRDPRQSIAHLQAAARIAAPLDDRVLTAVVSHALGMAQCSAGDYGPGVAQLRHGMVALDALSSDDRHRIDFTIYANVDIGRGAFILWLATAGHLREAVTIGEESVPRALGTGGWYRGLLTAHTYLGHPERTAEPFRQACAIDNAAHDYFSLGASCIIYLEAMLAYFAGDLAGRRQLAAQEEWAWQQACTIVPDFQVPQFAWLPLLFLEGHWDELVRLIPALQIPTSTHRWVIARVLGTLARLRGDAAGAWHWVRESLPHGPATAPGTAPFYIAEEMQRLAAALTLDAGDLPITREWLEAHDRWLAWSGAIFGQSQEQALWAEYYCQAGDAEQANQHAERARICAEQPRQPLALLTAHRLLGALDTEAGRYEGAAAHLDQSLTLATACAAPYERALTLLAMADLHAVTGSRPEARTCCAEAQAILTPLAATPALARAAALAARLAVIAERPATYPDGLSVREVEVLRLVGAGRNNQEIAETLFLSIRTVERHITNIYGKIAARSRADAAVYALRHLS
jgi:DNA-binding CsgD family transcriptional regulator